MLARVLQPLDHLALDGGAHGLGGRGADVVRGSLQLLLAGLIVGAGGAPLGGLHHVGRGVGESLGGGEQALLWRDIAVRNRTELIKFVNDLQVVLRVAVGTTYGHKTVPQHCCHQICYCGSIRKIKFWFVED